jgi:type IV pilus biogenesis protein PilP
MRAVSVPVTDSSGVSGFVSPRDRVDVVLGADFRHVAGESSGGGEDVLARYAAETVLRGVRVVAVGQAVARTGDGGPIQGKTATLEVTPKQAEKLLTSQLMGSLSLILRGVDEVDESSSEVAGVAGAEEASRPVVEDSGKDDVSSGRSSGGRSFMTDVQASGVLEAMAASRAAGAGKTARGEVRSPAADGDPSLKGPPDQAPRPSVSSSAAPSGERGKDGSDEPERSSGPPRLDPPRVLTVKGGGGRLSADLVLPSGRRLEVRSGSSLPDGTRIMRIDSDGVEFRFADGRLARVGVGGGGSFVEIFR